MLPIVYMSNEQGAPILNNAAGSMISLLDACLVTGFNTVGVQTVTVAGNVATVKTVAAHGLAVTNRITLSGLGISAANGDKEVATVVDTTTFTFPCVTANASDTPVSGSCKRTPLGFIKQFSKTNVAMYKSGSPQAYGQSLRVDDTGTNTVTQGVRVFGVENPTGIDAFTDKFPLETQVAGGLYWPKGANTTATKAWCLVGDERLFYLLVENSGYSTSYYPGGTAPNQYWAFYPVYFGDIASNKTTEAFGCMIGGQNNAPQNNGSTPYILSNLVMGSNPSTSSYSFIARQLTGIAKSIQMGFNHPGGRQPGSTSYPRYPSPVANELTIQEPVFVLESLSYANNPIRGIFPGMAAILCNHTDLPQAPFPQILTTTDGSNKTYLFAPYSVSTSSNAVDACFTVKLKESWR